MPLRGTRGHGPHTPGDALRIAAGAFRRSRSLYGQQLALLFRTHHRVGAAIRPSPPGPAAHLGSAMRVLELHAPLKVVQRSKGRSAVAAAAYRSGTRLVDQRTGLVHDYTRKRGIEDTALLVPEDAPEWAEDRTSLWNAAERNEKHPRAQTARDLEVSYPHEFDASQRREAGMRIGLWLTERYGAAVDIAWHAPGRGSDERNFHGHFLFTTRRFEDGDWAKTKDRVLDDRTKGPEEVKALRLGLADVLNNIAVRDQVPVYIEHLSFEQRGLDREPTQHLGPVATNKERAGNLTRIGDHNREVHARNEERQDIAAEVREVCQEVAREAIREKDGGQVPASPQSTEHALQAFYADAQLRRAGLLAWLDQQYVERERELQVRIAAIHSQHESTGFFARAWRRFTGQTHREHEEAARHQAELEEMQRARQVAHEQFEKDRQQRLEIFKSEQQREMNELRAIGEQQTRAAEARTSDIRQDAEAQTDKTAGPPDSQHAAAVQSQDAGASPVNTPEPATNNNSSCEPEQSAHERPRPDSNPGSAEQSAPLQSLNAEFDDGPDWDYGF